MWLQKQLIRLLIITNNLSRNQLQWFKLEKKCELILKVKKFNIFDKMQRNNTYNPGQKYWHMVNFRLQS